MAASGATSSERLDRLNPVERELLVLLGRGHTAKSIATLKGLSVPAVNERFRAARRKTGFSSSREIARLLAAQENRHDLIDLASGATAPSTLRRPDAPHPRRASFLRRWRLPMLATGLIAVALIAQQTATPPAQSPASAAVDDNLATQILSRTSPTPDLAFMHVEVARGPRDPAWSDATGYTLLQRYRQIPGFETSIQSFSLDCAATLCEAAGVTRPELSSDQVTALMSDLQTLGHPEPVPGLSQVVHHFSSPAEQSEGFAFVSYWRRRD